MGTAVQYTFEITISGCNTCCRHCYVSGGPGPDMDLSRYTKIIEKLARILPSQGHEISVTLGNEPMKHPQIAAILEVTQKTLPDFFSYENFALPTTGIALMEREDREEVLAQLRKAGGEKVMLTLHGAPQHHNLLVSNPKGFQSILSAADFFLNHGFQVHFNFMLNRFLTEDWDEMISLLPKDPKIDGHLTIPLYLPVQRLRKFQPYRAQYRDCLLLKNKLSVYSLDEEAFFDRVERFQEQAVAEQIKDWDFAERDKAQPQWAFFHIDQSGEFYYGNVGQHSRHLGNFLEMEEQKLRQVIFSLPANYDYSAYYRLDTLPSMGELREKILPLRSDYVFPDGESCLYYWLDQLQIPGILL